MPSTQTDIIDGVTTSAAIKVPVRCVATVNVTLSGLQTVTASEGSIAVVNGDRVALSAQTNPIENGIWVARATAWERAKDADGTRDLKSGTQFNTQGGQSWRITGTEPLLPGTSALTLTQVATDLTIDTDGTLAANSDSLIPSQKAVKTYVGAQDAAAAAALAASGGAALVGTAGGGTVEDKVRQKFTAKAAGYTVVAADHNKVIRCTAALTLDLTAAATLGDGFAFEVIADGGDVTIDPNAAETINGGTTITIKDGGSAQVRCNGTLFTAHRHLFNKVFETAEIATTSSTNADIAHGLGGIPLRFDAALRCKTAEHGWAVGDEIQVSGDPDIGSGGGVNKGVTIGVNTTNVRYTIGSEGILIVNRTSWIGASVTPANWRLVIRAYR